MPYREAYDHNGKRVTADMLSEASGVSEITIIRLTRELRRKLDL